MPEPSVRGHSAPAPGSIRSNHRLPRRRRRGRPNGKADPVFYEMATQHAMQVGVGSFAEEIDILVTWHDVANSWFAWRNRSHEHLGK